MIKNKQSHQKSNPENNILFLFRFFRSIDRGNQGYSDFPAEIFQPFIFSIGNNVCFVQQRQPVTCFVSLIQSNLSFTTPVHHQPRILHEKKRNFRLPQRSCLKFRMHYIPFFRNSAFPVVFLIFQFPGS